jgi:hypothetical protein
VLADEPIVHDHRDPDSRVLLVIRKIIVHDDQDWGDGDIRIRVEVRTNGQECSPAETASCGRLLVRSEFPELHASDGATVQLNRYIPRTGDYFVDPAISPDVGIPIHLGDRYVIRFEGTEIDPVDNDNMGTLDTNIIGANGQIRFGTYTERGFGACVNLPPPAVPFCAPGVPAAYSVEHEIREAPLPDLRPVDIKVLDAPGSAEKLVCMAIQNAGPANAGPFVAALQVDGITPPKGRAQAGGLPLGEAGELCVQTTLPSSGQHRLAVIADEYQAVVEVSETNNRFEEPYISPRISGPESPVAQPPVGNADAGQTITASPSAPSAPTGPVARPTAPLAQADLTIGAIRVNGQVPDGKGDCTDGKHAVAVVVKNGGALDAETFVVRLIVDDAQGDAMEQSVSGLEVGKEREVRFGDVRLKKGEHKLAVTVDSKQTVAESDEDNNGRTVTATCRDGL